MLEAISNKLQATVINLDLYEEIKSLQTGEDINPESIRSQAKDAKGGVDQVAKRLNRLTKLGGKFYWWRNVALILGFLALLVSKILEPYVLGA